MRAESPRPDWRIALALAAAVFAIFGQTFGYPFVDLDDPHAVYDNPFIRDGISWRGIVWAFTQIELFYWQPLTWLSHMLDSQIFGLNAGWHHLMNTVIHAVNGVLVYWLFAMLTGARWRSAILAAIFAVHPLRVESVAWVAERKDVLSCLFWLLTCHAYVRYLRAPAARRYGMVAAAALLAMMSKPMAVTVPLALLWLDLWPLGRLQVGRWREQLPGLLREKIPLFALSAAVIVITLAGNQGTGALVQASDLPFRLRLGGAIVGYAEYLRMTVAPYPLAAFYPYVVHPAWKIGLSLALLGGITVAAWRIAGRYPFLLAGWLWFTASLVPAIGLFQTGGQAFADRFTYIPHIGLLAAAVWGAAHVLERRRTLAVAIVAVLIAGLGIRAFFQVHTWRDSETLYRHAIAVTPENEPIYRNLSIMYTRMGRFSDAETAIREAIRFEPARPENRVRLGAILALAGRPSDAVTAYRAALRLDPTYTAARKELAGALMKASRTGEALAEWRKVQQEAPNDTEAGRMVAMLEMFQGESAEPATEPETEAEPAATQAEIDPTAEFFASPEWTAEEVAQGMAWLALAVVALAFPGAGRRATRSAAQWATRFGRDTRRAMLILGGGAIAIRLILLPLYPPPLPTVHDEFGYLLIADTLSQGRLANPPHRHAEHFESAYVLQEPTYTSKYPPGPAMPMALAKIFGVPEWFGVWLAAGAAAALWFWMLRGWLPPVWAVAGTLTGISSYLLLSHWMNSYWGGAFAAAGGALVFGALPRLLRNPAPASGALLGLGLVMLLWSRPYEGAFAGAVAGGAVLLRLMRPPRAWTPLLALGGVLLAGGLWFAYYNNSVTGSPWLLPYQLNRQIQGTPTTFYWQAPAAEPADLSPDLAEKYRWQRAAHEAGESWSGFVAVTGAKAERFLRFFAAPPIWIALLLLPLTLRRRRLRIAWIALAATLAGMALYPFFFPHYAAPVAGVILLLLMESLRRLSAWRWHGHDVGRRIAFYTIALAAGMPLLIVPGDALGPRLTERRSPRVQVADALLERGGRHLIFVRTDEPSLHRVVIANNADIDRSPIVWARDLGAEKNEELIQYYRTRSVWVFEADARPPRLDPYRAEDR
ncbi:MAG: glycosyltransferase family 39 protein [Bryobacterales bacterium]|nr:glycosyltransferase family 39 protein [Bryobacterales bacterium]